MYFYVFFSEGKINDVTGQTSVLDDEEENGKLIKLHICQPW